MLIRNLFAIIAAAAAFSAWAHHGWSDYDASKTLTLTGTIVESKYENPHATVHSNPATPPGLPGSHR